MTTRRTVPMSATGSLTGFIASHSTSPETEREVSWPGGRRRRALCCRSFRSSLGYCHAHFEFPSPDLIVAEQHSGLVAGQGAALAAS
jgi:hypothetical protein